MIEMRRNFGMVVTHNAHSQVLVFIDMETRKSWPSIRAQADLHDRCCEKDNILCLRLTFMKLTTQQEIRSPSLSTPHE